MDTPAAPQQPSKAQINVRIVAPIIAVLILFLSILAAWLIHRARKAASKKKNTNEDIELANRPDVLPAHIREQQMWARPPPAVNNNNPAHIPRAAPPARRHPTEFFTHNEARRAELARNTAAFQAGPSAATAQPPPANTMTQSLPTLPAPKPIEYYTRSYARRAELERNTERIDLSPRHLAPPPPAPVAAADLKRQSRAFREVKTYGGVTPPARASSNRQGQTYGNFTPKGQPSSRPQEPPAKNPYKLHYDN